MSKIAFLLDRFELQSPAQQLLDRLLIGYNQNGQFHRSTSPVIVSLPGANENRLVQTRVKDFGLHVASSAEHALAAADAVVVESHNGRNEVGKIVQSLPTGKPCFVLGALARTASAAKLIMDAARTRSVPLAADTAASYLIPLPKRPVYDSRKVERLLLLTQGNFPETELEALYAMLPYLDAHDIQSGVQQVEPVERQFIWRMLYSRTWLPLLQAAVSRSNNIKGDPDKDGRTQDIVSLRMTEKLAPEPRAWLLRVGNVEVAISVLEGALADLNMALQCGAEIRSAQLYRAPSPLRDHFSDLTASVLTFFSARMTSSKLQEAHCVATALEMMERRS